MWGASALVLLISPALGCGARVGKGELRHASSVLSCPSVRLVAPAPGRKSLGAKVQQIHGCGKAMYFREQCDTQNRRCMLKGDDASVLQHAAAVIPCDAGALRIEHVAETGYRVSGCGAIAEYSSDVSGFALARMSRAQPNAVAAAGGPILGQQIQRSRAPLSPASVFARSYQSTFVVIAGKKQGTGFAISTNGLVVTNLHVIAGESDIVVRFVDNHEGRALHVEAFDEKQDLALVRIDRNLHALPLGERDHIAIGESIVTIGNPLGLQATISEGIVSGVRRTDQGMEFVQTTAPISPGSSGGPIFNQHGEVIGVSTFILRGGSNLGFGVPAKYVQELLGRRRFVSLPEFARATAESGEGAASCSSEDTAGLKARAATALEAGAELEKSGRWLAARQLYEGAIVDIVSVLTETCRGPRRLLDDARGEATPLPSDRQRALVLRQAIERVRVPGE